MDSAEPQDHDVETLGKYPIRDSGGFDGKERQPGQGLTFSACRQVGAAARDPEFIAESGETERAYVPADSETRPR